MPATSYEVPTNQRTQGHSWFQDIIGCHLEITCIKSKGSLGDTTVNPYISVIGHGTMTFRDMKHPHQPFRMHEVVSVQIGYVASSRYRKRSISGRTFTPGCLASRYLAQALVTDIEDIQIISIVVGCKNHLQVLKGLP